MRLLLSAVLLLAPVTSASAENFSCSFGRGACLDYGDTVCSSLGKCVDQSAQCFSSYTCNYQGFVCKSDFDDLQRTAKQIALDYDALVVKAEAIASSYDDLRRCLATANTMSDVSTCRLLAN
jgi:hypothetical protein